ncbi:MAG: hypothetical protein EOO31_09830 [Comamonadaceae bacterium]|nr:MAG: hypothetical protein EOO31_09830 [Comamonadaceae bacterium]
MSMTVAALHKALGKLIEQGHGRKPVQINKGTFRHPLEDDGVVIMGVEAIDGPQWLPTADDDGGTKWNKDGTEAGKRVVILKGGSNDR